MGEGVYLGNASVTFLFFDMELLWVDINYDIERENWLNRSKGNFSRSVRSNLALFALGGHLLQNC